MDKVANPNVVKQSNPTACGAAYGVITTKKSPEILAQYESANETQTGSTSTTQHGKYGFVKDSKVFFNSTTNNAVVLDASGSL